MSSRCNVANCCNDRRYRERWIVLPHVGELKFHKPAAEDYAKWENKLQRPGYAVSANTRVCSNHFRYGKPLNDSHIPSLHLRSYPAWAVPVNKLRDDIAAVSDDIVCEVLAHMCQYALDGERKYLVSTIQDVTGSTWTEEDLPYRCFDLEKNVARKLIDHLKFMIPVGKTLECLAIFQCGIEIDGSKPILKKAKQQSSRKRKLSAEQPPSSPDCAYDVHVFHSYSTCDIVSTSGCSNAVTANQSLGEPCDMEMPPGKTCKRKSCQKKIETLQAQVKALEEEVKGLNIKNKSLTRERNEKREEVEKLKAASANPSPVRSPKLSIDAIKDNDNLIMLHTGLPNYALFKWIYDQVEETASAMTYWDSRVDPGESQNKKPGPARKIPLQDELLITLMKLKLNMTGEYIAFLFDISPSSVSNIISTWIPMLSQELSGLIYWPSREEVKLCYPQCFKQWSGITAILDCFEIPTQRPSHVEANSQVFSTYKNRPTSKFLLACTPGGSISFISSAAGGNMSDKEMVISSGIMDNFSCGDKCMVDKGFKIKGELLERGVDLIIPPFVRQGKPFTDDENKENKQIAHSRIHVERVIGRLRDYAYVNAVIPINQLDLVTPAVKVCCALTNLKNSVVN